ncbi:hypothetical protein Taro_030924 [Colocasia esculenta]|uniref:Tonoplast dicarboxylate transporter n=1 Tax=Colocasia esculenta TaxID=4460 RepID=A0A843VT84_COLES|nr:hypothetical protein [Colocasia esculenta]
MATPQKKPTGFRAAAHLPPNPQHIPLQPHPPINPAACNQSQLHPWCHSSSSVNYSVPLQQASQQPPISRNQEPNTTQTTFPFMENPRAPLLPVQNGSSAPRRPPKFHLPANAVLVTKYLTLLSGPLACLLVCLLAPVDGAGRSMLAAMAWVFLWWLTEAVPVPVASLAPLFLFPILGIASAETVARSYMNDVISLVIGSFILALAVEHYSIHQRLALNITLLFCGDTPNPALLLLGICATTAFISFWMQNTAAAVMMMPVATGILQRFPEGAAAPPPVVGFCKAVVLGVIYSAAIGGMATLTGTGVNLITVGMWEAYFPEARPIGFATWFMFGFPLALLCFLALWGVLCLLYCPHGGAATSLSAYLDRNHLRRELEGLGPMAFAEKMVLSVFALLVVLWMTRSITNSIPGWGSLFHVHVGDGTVSVSPFFWKTLFLTFDSHACACMQILMATLLFIIPSGKQEGEKLMDWAKCKKLPWGVVLLLGAGFAIADGVRSTGLADLLSAGLGFLRSVPYLAVAPLVCLVSSTITEFTSNNATATLVIPLLIQLAPSIGVHPLLLVIPGAFGAEYAFLLPTGTPSNIVGFSTGRIDIKDMLMTGLPLKVAAIATIAVLTPTLGEST